MPLKKKLPCQTPGCNWPVWHPCLVGKPDTFPQLLAAEARAAGETGEKKPRAGHVKTQEHRDAIAQAQRERWARVREANRPRDEKIVNRYAEGNVSVRGLETEFGVGRRVVLNVLHAAEKEGLIKVRKPGHTLAKGVA